MKKRRRQQPRRLETTSGPRPVETNWMSVLASVAAESRVDGGTKLQNLLHRARFDERPQLSLTKRAA